MHQYDLCHSWLLDHLVSEICSITELLHIFSFVTRLFIDLVIEGVFFCSANLDVCVCVVAFLSYLLAVGLESGRILLYSWSPGQEPAGGHDWSCCGQTDFSYPLQHTNTRFI